MIMMTWRKEEFLGVSRNSGGNPSQPCLQDRWTGLLPTLSPQAVFHSRMIRKPAKTCPRLCRLELGGGGGPRTQGALLFQLALSFSPGFWPEGFISQHTPNTSATGQVGYHGLIAACPEVMVSYVWGSFSSKTESEVGMETGTKWAFLSGLGTAYQNSFSYQASTKCLEMTFPVRGNGPAVLFLAFSHLWNRKNINQWKKCSLSVNLTHEFAIVWEIVLSNVFTSPFYYMDGKELLIWLKPHVLHLQRCFIFSLAENIW